MAGRFRATDQQWQTDALRAWTISAEKIPKFPVQKIQVSLQGQIFNHSHRTKCLDHYKCINIAVRQKST